MKMQGKQLKSSTIEVFIDLKSFTKKQLTEISPSILMRRVSDISQQDGYSLSAQLRYGTEYSDDNGFLLIADYSFTETASKHHLRANFDKLVNDVEKIFKLTQKPVQLIVEKPDRLSRNFTSKEKLQRLAKEGKLVIHYYKDRRIFDKNCTPADIFNDDIQTAVSKYAANNIARETEKGMLEKAKSGVFPGLAPLGYKNVRSTAETKNKRGKASIVVDPDKRCVDGVKRMFELRAQNYSFDAIKDQILLEQILPPEKALTLCRTGIEKILKNIFYTGKFFWRGELHQGKQDLIIPQAHLDIVFNRPKGGHSNRDRGTFDGLLTCAHCGCAIIHDPKTKVLKSTGKTKTYPYYHCTDGKRLHRQIDKKQVNVSEVEIWEQYGKMIESFSLHPDVVDLISAGVKTLHNKTKAQQEGLIKRNKQAIASLEQKEDDLLELRLSQSIDQETYTRGRDKIREEKQTFTREIERVQETLADGFNLQSDFILELANKAKLLWNEVDAEKRIQLLKKVLSNQSLNGKILEFTLRKPFQVLKEIKNFKEIKKNLSDEGEVLKLWCPARDLNPHDVANGGF